MTHLNHVFPATQAADTVAPAGGIVAGTPVLTLDGELPVQFLAPGDRIVTRNGAREIAAVEVGVIYGAAMIRIAPGALGRGRPEAELFVAPDQPLPILEASARALVGGAAGVVPAALLVDGLGIRRETVAEARLYLLHFAAEEVIYAAGLDLACPQSAH